MYAIFAALLVMVLEDDRQSFLYINFVNNTLLYDMKLAFICLITREGNGIVDGPRNHCSSC